MQKTFYASGFLFCPKLHKILLLKSQKNKDMPPIWSTLGGESNNGEDGNDAFSRIITRLLNLNLKAKSIYPIYDYFHEILNKDNFVFYAEVKVCKKFEAQKDITFEWVAFDEVGKLAFAPRVKQDVIVGERVINAKWRDNEASKQAAITSQI